MKPHYPVEIHYSAEDEGFIATLPDLPGCSAWGATEAEALAESHAAAAAWLIAFKATGNPIPAASNPANESDYSGRFVMRIPKRLHADLSRGARRQGVSLNQYVLYLLAAREAASKDEARA